MRTVIILLITLLSTPAFCQESNQTKSIDRSEMEVKLAETKTDISILESKIEAINNRVAGIPEDEVDQGVKDNLARTEKKKSQLERIAYSIESYLNGGGTKKVTFILKEEFDSYPQNVQQRLLEHSDEYKIVD